jgi:hypothetical protein
MRVKLAAVPLLLVAVAVAACDNLPTGSAPHAAAERTAAKRATWGPTATGNTAAVTEHSATAGGARMDDNGFGAGSGYAYSPPPPPGP